MTTLDPGSVQQFQPMFSELEETTLLGFVAGYRGFREAYTLDLRLFSAWCRQHNHHLFDVCPGTCLLPAGEVRGIAPESVLLRR